MSVAFLKLACVAGEEDPQTGTVRSPLAVDPDPGDPPEPTDPPGTGGPCTNASVVSIQNHNGVSIASAVVLAPDLLLTAGHLVLTQEGQVDNPEASKLSVSKGATACAHGPSTITGVLKHPSFAWGTATDLAVIRISPPLTGVTPVSLFGTPTMGGLVTLTAYGNTSATGGSGVERCTNGTVSYVDPNGVDVDFGTGQACQGDSGGAIFERGTSRLMGILWGGAGSNVQCSSTGRVATDLQFARNAVTNPPTFAAVSCTPQTYTPCLRETRTCPGSASLFCQFDERECLSNGTRGACQAKTYTPTCLQNQVWNQNTCECVTAPTTTTGGGSGSTGSGGGWYPGGGGGGCYDVFAADVCYWGGTGMASICYDDWGFWYTEFDFINCYAG